MKVGSIKETKKQSTQMGITLVALVVTIVILIILATISINLVLNGGLINKSQSGAELYKREAAKEKLSLTLASAGMEKIVNSEYNQNEFLDAYILRECSGAKIIGDFVIVDGYAFEIDRSVPKIKEYKGKEEELSFPNVDLSVEPAEDKKTAKIKITAIEKENGISQIEVIKDGQVIKSEKYSNQKEKIEIEYQVEQNGNYIVKVYSKLTVTKIVEVNTIEILVKYSPNGDTTYKKEHSVKVSINSKEADTVQSVKYQWTNSTNQPAENTFMQTCEKEATITNKQLTGQYYLWVLVEKAGGFKQIERSNAFYFDNQTPNVTVAKNYSKQNGKDIVKVNANANDAHSNIKECKIKIVKHDTNEEVVAETAIAGNGANYNYTFSPETLEELYKRSSYS